MKIRCHYKFINSKTDIEIISITEFTGEISGQSDPKCSYQLLHSVDIKENDFRNILGIHDIILMDLNKCKLTDEPTITNDVLRSEELKKFLRNKKIKKML